jgi:cation diffusion facilitator family transporter
MVRAAALSVVSNTTLVIAKLAAGLWTGSVSVISEAVHSGLDVAAAVMTLFSVRRSSEPPDEEHRYGHGKIENLSALVEALLIFVAVGWIVAEALRKLLGGAEVASPGIGFVVMAASGVVKYAVSEHLFRVGRKADSLALQADALQQRTDVYTSAGVALGLAVIHFTGASVLDPVIALGVAALILKAAWDLVLKSLGPLLDVRLPVQEEETLREIVESFRDEYVGFHKLRTRKAGPERHIDLHLVVHPDRSLADAHDLADRIEQSIEERWDRTSVLIHMEPCRARDCAGCSNPCQTPPGDRKAGVRQREGRGPGREAVEG